MPARILLIEDKLPNLELMTYLLEAFGYTPLPAMDGTAGLSAAERERPDLIICDVQLPTIDGLEVARRIKADPKLCTIPIVAVTALAMVGDRDRVLAAGFDGYITKPIDPETFVRQLESYLPPGQHAAPPDPVATTTFIPTKPPIRHTVLVVDNLPVNLDLARTILEPHGYHVVTAEGMEEGLALAKAGAFDLVVSDICMGARSGYDFIVAMKADPRLRSIPFVFITSTMLEEKDRIKGLALGAARFLVRPLSPLRLIVELEGCLRLEKGGGRVDNPDR